MYPHYSVISTIWYRASLKSWLQGRKCKNYFLIHHLFHSQLHDSHSIQFSDPNQIVFVFSESNLVFWLHHQVLLGQDFFLQQTHSIFHLAPTKMIFEFLTDRLLKLRVTSQFTKSFSFSLPESRTMKPNSGKFWPKRFKSYSRRVIFLYLFLARFLFLTRRLLRFKYLTRLRDNRIFRENKLILRIPTVKLKIPGRPFLKPESRTSSYIQVIVFDLSYLPVAPVGT